MPYSAAASSYAPANADDGVGPVGRYHDVLVFGAGARRRSVQTCSRAAAASPVEVRVAEPASVGVAPALRVQTCDRGGIDWGGRPVATRAYGRTRGDSSAVSPVIRTLASQSSAARAAS